MSQFFCSRYLFSLSMQLPLWIMQTFHHSELLQLIFFLQQKCLLLVFHFDNDFLEYRCDTFSATDISFLCCVPHGLCKRSFRNQLDYRNFFLQQKYPFWVVSPMDPANLHSEIDLKLFLQQKLSILCSIPHELCKLLFRIDLIILILFVVAPVELFPDPAPE